MFSHLGFSHQEGAFWVWTGGGFPGGVCLSFGGDRAAAAPNPPDTGTLLESTSCWPLCGKGSFI